MTTWDDEIRARGGWGRWPDTRFVEWAMKTFGKASDRSAVKFLEFGCGGGAQLRFLQSENFRFLGVDSSAGAISQARTLLWDGVAGDERYAVFGDLRTFQPEPGSELFDCVFDVCTLQHFDDEEARKIVERAWSWLKPGGWLFSKAAVTGYTRPSAIPLYVRTPAQMWGVFQPAATGEFQPAVEEVIDPDRWYLIVTARKPAGQVATASPPAS